jgi:hypothetical protein
MIDYSVNDDWPEDDRDWLTSLVSSLDRNHDASTVLPLTVIVEEIAEWTELASGTDAWKKTANRDSLQRDLDESVGAVRSSLRSHIAGPLAAFKAAFANLTRSSSTVLSQPPGTRVDAVWTEALSTARTLLNALNSDQAVRANWDDLTATAQDRTLARREYRPIAELLFEQLQRRGLDAESTFRALVSMVAYGRVPGEKPAGRKDTPLAERLVNARTFVGRPPQSSRSSSGSDTRVGSISTSPQGACRSSMRIGQYRTQGRTGRTSSTRQSSGISSSMAPCSRSRS